MPDIPVLMPIPRAVFRYVESSSPVEIHQEQYETDALAANLIDRLYAPGKFLETIHERMLPGGVLVLTSPYTWDEAYTKKEEWLGGSRDAGEPAWTLAALKEILAPHFCMLGDPRDVPFVIRETCRKFQHSVAERHHNQDVFQPKRTWRLSLSCNLRRVQFLLSNHWR